MAPGESSGLGMFGTLANASAPKNPPQAKRYVSDRPKGIAEPIACQLDM